LPWLFPDVPRANADTIEYFHWPTTIANEPYVGMRCGLVALLGVQANRIILALDGVDANLRDIGRTSHPLVANANDKRNAAG